MQFEYLALADSANDGADGKVNVLGLGARIISYERLPGSSPLALIALVSASIDEAGEYDLLLELEEPDGTTETMVEAKGRVAEDGNPLVPTGISLVLNFMRPFRIEGVHAFHLRVGEIERRHEFLVRLAKVADGAGAQPLGASTSRRGARKVYSEDGRARATKPVARRGPRKVTAR